MPNSTAIDYSFDPELMSQAEALKQQDAVAQMLAQRSGQPLQFGAGRGSPFQVLGKWAEAGAGAQLQKKNTEERRALGEAYNTKLAAGVQDYMRQRMGAPEIQQPPEELGGGPGRPAIAGDPKAAMISALLSRNPAVRSLGTMDYAAEEKRKEGKVLAPDALWSRPPDAGGNVTNRKPAEHAVPDGWEKHVPTGAKVEGRGVVRMAGADGLPDLYTMEFERGEFRGLKKLDNSPKGATVKVNQESPITVTDLIDPTDPSRSIRVDGRTYKGGGLGSPGVLGLSPKEGDAAKRENKRQFNMQGIGSAFQQAEDLLKGVKRNPDGTEGKAPKPTGSWIGTAVDTAGAVVGKSPSGSVQAQELKVVSGALTSKMPRMEGPQSNYDLQLYREMAAEVGNSNLPVDRRLAALQKVKDLWQKYERLNPEAFSDRRAASAGDEPPPGAVRPRGKP